MMKKYLLIVVFSVASCVSLFSQERGFDSSKYDHVWDESEGLYRVRRGSLFGFVDKDGREVLPLKYYFAYDFSEGVAAVRYDGKFGSGGLNGISCLYTNGYRINDGYA